MPDTTSPEPAAYLDMPPERRAAAMVHVTAISATVRAAALGVPLTADVDDFRRILVAAAPTEAS